MPKSTQPSGFSFGQHYICACCGKKIVEGVHAMKHPTRIQTFIQVRAENPSDWQATMDDFKDLNYIPVIICNQC